MGIDDFEVCSPLKTKAGVHKVTGIYCHIRNLPAEYNSRLDNMHLVAICNVQDFKQADASFDDVLKLIVNDIQTLQTNGIDIGDNKNLKGTLINICADNLGANEVFGFVKSFNTDGFCRICSVSKKVSETQVKEDPELIRKKDDYMDYVQIAANGGNTKESKGIVHYCLFNDIEYFHILDNYSIDIMHDALEGIIYVFIRFFLNIIIDRKILKPDEISDMIRDFNYGLLGKRNKPSKVIFTKRNFNQNATQSYNIMLNMPFIFYNQKNDLEDIWPIMEQLLQILQIIFSSKISENDLVRLDGLTTKFLSDLVQNGVKLTPKLHNLIHYVRVLRLMGPLIHMWAMRVEAKHKFFTEIAKSTNNFKNIAKTLASRHQQLAALKTDLFLDKIIPSVQKKKFINTPEYEKYQSSNIFPSDFNFNECDSLEFLKINGNEYRKKLMLLIDGSVLQIKSILSTKLGYSLVCSNFKINEFNAHLNSIDVDITGQYTLVELNAKYPKVYEKKNLIGKNFIIADTLDVYNNFTV